MTDPRATPDRAATPWMCDWCGSATQPPSSEDLDICQRCAEHEDVREVYGLPTEGETDA